LSSGRWPFGQSLPVGAVCTRTTATWTENTLPAELKTVLRTREGVGAVVTILEGAVRLRSLPEDVDAQLAAGDAVVVDPEHDHGLTPDPLMKFQIAFFRAGMNER